MAAGFASAAANIRGRVSELDHAHAGSPESWGWSGLTASDYTRTWQTWRTAAGELADRMDASGVGARQILNHLADELERAQRAYDDAVARAQTLGLGVDNDGYVTPRLVPSPAPLAAGSPEQKIEEQVATADQQGNDALEAAGEQLHAIFGENWYADAGYLNDFLAAPTNLQSVAMTPTSIYSGLKYAQSARDLPGLAARVFGDEVGPVALAYDRGEATYAELMAAVRVGLNRIEVAKVFTVVRDRASFMDGGVAANGLLDIIGKVAIPVAIISDVTTLINPGPGGDGEQLVTRVAAGANLIGSVVVGADMLGVGGGLLAADAALGWVPVAGQVLLVASGLVLAGLWAYNNVQPFHDFCNAAGSATMHVAQDAWNNVTAQVSDVKHAAAQVGNFVGGATHALQGFFHWP